MDRSSHYSFVAAESQDWTEQLHQPVEIAVLLPVSLVWAHCGGFWIRGRVKEKRERKRLKWGREKKKEREGMRVVQDAGRAFL